MDQFCVFDTSYVSLFFIYHHTMMKLIYIIVALLPQLVSPHGYLSQPVGKYYDEMTKTTFITRVNAYELFPSYKWDYDPDENAATYKRLVQSGGIDQPLKSFMDRYINGCPINDMSVVIDVSSLDSMHWQNDQAHEGFVSSHRGPCEVWIDSIQVLSELNCAKRYSDYPAVLPIDYSVCQGGCVLSFYWMALHESMWQLYKGCVAIQNSNQNHVFNFTTSLAESEISDINRVTTNYINDGGLSPESQGVSLLGETITLSVAASPRIYMLDQAGSAYQMFDLNDKVIEFDVDITNIPCDYNLAFYFSEMSSDSNIGSGYCDAQGFSAAPCGEMDIFEANIIAAHITTHPCENGSCDKSGSGQEIMFANSGMSSKLHIKTSFKTENGVLSDITQIITDTNENSQTLTITDTGANGGFSSMGQSFKNGMVLIMSLWTNGAGGMEWLNGQCNSYETDTSKVYGSFSNIDVSDL